MTLDIWALLRGVADDSNWDAATFDQLAEEVMELHLSLRGKHNDTPAMEWLEIATIAINAFRMLPEHEQVKAYAEWQTRHGDVFRAERRKGGGA